MKILIGFFIGLSFNIFGSDPLDLRTKNQLLKMGLLKEGQSFMVESKSYTIKAGKIVENDTLNSVDQDFICRNFPGYEGQLKYLLKDNSLNIHETPQNSWLRKGTTYLSNCLITGLSEEEAKKYVLYFDDGKTFNLSELFAN